MGNVVIPGRSSNVLVFFNFHSYIYNITLNSLVVCVCFRGVEECEHKIRTGKDIPKRFPRTISWDDTAISATNMTFKGKYG